MPTANELYAESTCFLCYGVTQAQALKLALLKRQVLALNPDADVTPETLLSLGACYACYTDGSLFDLFELALLNLVAENSSGAGGVAFLLLDGQQPETLTNTFQLGANNLAWGYTTLECNLISTTGTINLFGASGADGLTSITFPRLTSAAVIAASSAAGAMNTLQTLSFPVLASTTGLFTCTSTGLITLSVPLLVTVAGVTLTAVSATPTSLSFPSLVTCSGGFNCLNRSGLASFSAPNWLPTNGQTISFSGCALSQVSVDHVLARAVASAGYVSGTITLSGGTNSTPSAAGLADKAILVGRGCTVNNN